MKTFIVILLLSLSSVQSFSQDTTGTVIILSDKIGPSLDLEERNIYKMFMSIENFESAVLLQRSDGSYLFKVTEKKEGESSVKIRWISTNEDEVERIRYHIEGMPYEVAQNSDSVITKPKSKHKYFGAEIGIMTPSNLSAWDCYTDLVLDLKVIGFEFSVSFLCSIPVVSQNIIITFFPDRLIKPFITVGRGECTEHEDEIFLNVGGGIRYKINRHVFGKAEFRGWATFGEGSAELMQIGIQYFF